MSHHYHEDDEDWRKETTYTKSTVIKMVEEAQKQALENASYEDLVKELEKRHRAYHDALVNVPSEVLRRELQQREEDSMKPKLLVEEK